MVTGNFSQGLPNSNEGRKSNIFVTCLSCPYKGQKRQVPEGMNPAAFFNDMIQKGWQWELDYSRATNAEIIKWVGQELMSRAIRAVKEGRPVTFNGQTYRSFDELQKLEDAIVVSNAMVTLGSDDEKGVVIVARGEDQKTSSN